MGRLITPVSRVELTQGNGANQQIDSAAERIVKYIPAEVVAFYLAALGIIHTVPNDKEAMRNRAYLFALIVGVIAAPLYIIVVGKKGQAGKWLMGVWSVPAFLVWAYNLGGMFEVWGIHQHFIGSLLLLTLMLVAGLLPIPRE